MYFNYLVWFRGDSRFINFFVSCLFIRLWYFFMDRRRKCSAWSNICWTWKLQIVKGNEIGGKILMCSRKVTLKNGWFRNTFGLNMGFCFLSILRGQLKKSRVNSWLNSRSDHGNQFIYLLKIYKVFFFRIGGFFLNWFSVMGCLKLISSIEKFLKMKSEASKKESKNYLRGLFLLSSWKGFLGFRSFALLSWPNGGLSSQYSNILHEVF